MENKSGFRRFLDYLEEHKLAAVAILLVLGCVVWSVVKNAAAPTREEQVNFAVTAFAHHSDGKEEKFRELLTPIGIREVNLSVFDISDPSGTSEYLLTYGYYEADIFVLDTTIGASVLVDCFYRFSEEQIGELTGALGFTPHFIWQEGDVVGVVIHEQGNDAYNAHFSYCHEWLLFGAEGTEYDYAVFFHADSCHNETANFALLQFILQ